MSFLGKLGQVVGFIFVIICVLIACFCLFLFIVVYAIFAYVRLLFTNPRELWYFHIRSVCPICQGDVIPVGYPGMPFGEQHYKCVNSGETCWWGMFRNKREMLAWRRRNSFGEKKCGGFKNGKRKNKK